PKTVAQDLVQTPVQFDDTDRFCLDGVRLVAIQGDYGADGTEYRAEVDTFSRVFSRGRSTLGPDSFEVFSRDGRILKYGTTESSSISADIGQGIKRAWALDTVSDRSGNEITVTYKKFDGTPTVCASDRSECATKEFFPETIAYGGHPDLSLEHSRFVK